MHKGQFGVEYLVILGIVLLIATPLIIYSVNKMGLESATFQAKKTAAMLASAVDDVGTHGYPARKTVNIVLPETVGEGSSLGNSTVTVVLNQPGGGVEHTVGLHTKCAYGHLPNKPGSYQVTVYAGQDGYVHATVDLMLIQPDSIAVSLNKGTNTTNSIWITNFANPANVSMTASGAAAPYIDLNPSTPGIQTSFFFSVDYTKDMPLVLYAAPTAGVVSGSINVTSGRFSKLIPVTIETIGVGPKKVTIDTYEDSTYTRTRYVYARGDPVYVEINCLEGSGPFYIYKDGPDHLRELLQMGTCPTTRMAVNTTNDHLGSWRIIAVSDYMTDYAQYIVVRHSIHYIDLGHSMYPRAGAMYFSVFSQKGGGYSMEQECTLECTSDCPSSGYSWTIPMGTGGWKFKEDSCNQCSNPCQPSQCPVNSNLKNWYQYGFDDLSWQTTLLPHTKYIWTTLGVTRMYRKHFTLSNAAKVSGVRVSYQADEGAVCYINGHQIGTESTCQTDYPPQVKTWERTDSEFLQYLNEGDNLLACRVVEQKKGQTEFRYFDVGLEVKQSDTIVPMSTSGWKYLQKTNCGDTCDPKKVTCSLPSGWTQIGFDDSSWNPASMPNNGWGTCEHMCSRLYRKTFTLSSSDVSTAESLIVNCQSDEGCVCYINGQEIGHDPTCKPHYITPPKTWEVHDVSILRPGTNVLACQVTQYNGGDIEYFDAGLELTTSCDHTFSCTEDCHQQRHSCEDACIAEETFGTCFQACTTQEQGCRSKCTDPHPCLTACHDGYHTCGYGCMDTYAACTTGCSGPNKYYCIQNCLSDLDTCGQICTASELSCRTACGEYGACKYGCHQERHDCSLGCFKETQGTICNNCTGCDKIHSLTMQYLGNDQGTFVNSYDDSGHFLKSYAMNAQKKFIATEVFPPTASWVSFKVGNDQSPGIPTSCSNPIGAGQVYGNFKIADWDPDCPGRKGMCTPCKHVNSVSFKYTGWEDADTVYVYDSNNNLMANYTLDDNNEFTVSPVDAPKIKLAIGDYYRWITTSCSEPIGPKFVFGYFVVKDINAEGYNSTCIPECECSQQTSQCLKECLGAEEACADTCNCYPSCATITIKNKNGDILYSLSDPGSNKIFGEFNVMGNGTYSIIYNDTDNELTDANTLMVRIIDPSFPDNLLAQSKVFEMPNGAPKMAMRVIIEAPDTPNILYNTSLTIRAKVYDQNDTLVSSFTPAFEVRNETGGLVRTGNMSMDVDKSFYAILPAFTLSNDTTYYINVTVDSTSPYPIKLYGSRSFNGVLE